MVTESAYLIPWKCVRYRPYTNRQPYTNFVLLTTPLIDGGVVLIAASSDNHKYGTGEV